MTRIGLVWHGESSQLTCGRFPSCLRDGNRRASQRFECMPSVALPRLSPDFLFPLFLFHAGGVSVRHRFRVDSLFVYE